MQSNMQIYFFLKPSIFKRKMIDLKFYVCFGIFCFIDPSIILPVYLYIYVFAR